MTKAESSRVRFAPVNPLYTNWSGLPVEWTSRLWELNRRNIRNNMAYVHGTDVSFLNLGDVQCLSIYRFFQALLLGTVESSPVTTR